MIFQEADLSIRVVRDVLVEEFEGAVIDDPKQHERVTKFLQRTAPELADSVELYDDKEPVFERWGVEEAFDSVLNRRVDLPSGGYLMIDYAEALTVIDINTGSFTGRGKGRLEDTITKVNVEAAEEVVRQLRMRDIGGIIVIDFIDMARARNRDQVLKTMRTALDEDRTKTYVVEVSPLGLVEMTRQNVTDGVREILTKRCPTCDGEGVVFSEETVAIQIVRRLRDVVAADPEPDAYLVRVNPRVAAELLGPTPGSPSSRRRPASASTSRAATRFRSTPSTWSRRATARRSSSGRCPFRVGDEVLVTIEEPHMYNVDDAVARVDSYVVSVAGGGRHIGERKLVRIESVGRSAPRRRCSTATATWSSAPGERRRAARILVAPAGASAAAAGAAARSRPASKELDQSNHGRLRGSRDRR